ncbi:hypothetical protein [Haloprofundus salinisoli]|uniref:hypothetical protein n=1 Tax=Haloprofundus salinisoli TaxID=2876193 RepID=UPI001CCBC02A|nr:hypothetical protein [Haloprofundus salinisoli]
MQDTDNSTTSEKRAISLQSNGDHSRSTGRRPVLRGVGATLAAATGLGTTGVAAADDDTEAEEESDADSGDYETVHVDAGDTYDVNVGSGETLENVLYDISADGAALDISASGADWTIRNVGIEGEHEDSSKGNLFMFEVTDDDGTGLVENVYAAEGSYETDFAFVRKAHEGELTIRNVYLEGWQEGIYGSAPGIDDGGGDGPVHIENCYAKNNGVANYRLGSDGSSVRDSVAHVDERTSYSGYSRGVWVRNGGDVEASGMNILIDYENAAWGVAENDSIETGGVIRLADSSVESRAGRGDIDGTVETNDVDDDADVDVPDGVPQSAEEAASR